jgi:hypothetical protein
MHQEDKTNKRVVGYGLGVTRSHVFGIEAQLRKDKIGDCGGSSSDVMGLKSYLLSIERKNDELMRRNDEVMRQNDELMRRNDEVMRKKDEEVEELRAQNQKILTQLALVLDQLQQNQKTSKNHYQFYHQLNLFILLISAYGRSVVTNIFM